MIRPLFKHTSNIKKKKLQQNGMLVLLHLGHDAIHITSSTTFSTTLRVCGLWMGSEAATLENLTKAKSD